MDSLHDKVEQLALYARLMQEWGAQDAQSAVDVAMQTVQAETARVQSLPVDPRLAQKEPDDYERILALRPKAATRMRQKPDAALFEDKLSGALLCRAAGCTLGACVENWPIARMEEWAAHIGDPFPPADYWSQVFSPEALRYGKSRLKAFGKGYMHGVPADDDIAYTLLGLLIAERYGLDFTIENVGEAWVDWLPVACTAEEVALDNLRGGVPAQQAADRNNPYCQWIGAAIRSDPWAYIAAGWPELAARMAYRDAYVSHRRNGIYGEMYLAAAQAAAFCVDTAEEALQAGLLEIPENCRLAEDIRWALSCRDQLSDWRAARALVDARFEGMSSVHTNNNLCLVVFGLLLGGRDVTRTLGEIVAMALDNDCTAASAGSILGAIVGAKEIPTHWTQPFENTIVTYLNDHPVFAIDDVVRRFGALHARVWESRDA